MDTSIFILRVIVGWWWVVGVRWVRVGLGGCAKIWCKANIYAQVYLQ